MHDDDRFFEAVRKRLAEIVAEREAGKRLADEIADHPPLPPLRGACDPRYKPFWSR